MSDPRASGTEELQGVTRFTDRTDRAIPTEGEGVLTNDGGAWRGGGTVVFRTEGGSLVNYGEVTYLGGVATPACDIGTSTSAPTTVPSTPGGSSLRADLRRDHGPSPKPQSSPMIPRM